MTMAEKRKIVEAVDRCVRYDLLSDADAELIVDICAAAVDRAIKEQEEKDG